jgi:hypothetical protein
MDNGYGERRTDWLSLGAETVPLRNGKPREAEWEETERLRLIGKPSSSKITRASCSVLDWWRQLSRP